ncbi:FadR/GntR family transcriptional regulator [Luteimicrobium subarcticum]|uniref:DNA-binding FadR family transcriptional regulator n=1 Tax=Luteimicrobium subarcticum TaxID=620910 RepID=A0A2M8WTB9_9MICO|nr:FCD domain-containing protein [Luteimicrobium subarcticum]PJI94205.1 DNA-binding FadR family transcriptional regulator [Luteimicrobium subarcticum]
MPLVRTPLPEQAADALAARITAGEWAVGTTLPSEHALTAELGVGRSTVREAVRILAARGLVRARQGVGVLVTATVPPTDWDAALRSGHVADVVEARLGVEVQAARLAALRRTPADVDTMRDALAARAAVEDRHARERAQHARADLERAEHEPLRDAEYVDADAHLHATVVTACHNPVLVDLFGTFAPHVRVAMLDLLALSGPDSPHHHDQDAHVALVDAVVAGDPDAAARAADEHLTSVLDALRRTTEETL